MKKHTKIYIDTCGFTDTDFMPSEISGAKGVDIHHIVNRENRIENLMLLTRPEHIEYGEIKDKMFFLLITHKNYLDSIGVNYDEEWFNKYLMKYAD